MLFLHFSTHPTCVDILAILIAFWMWFTSLLFSPGVSGMRSPETWGYRSAKHVIGQHPSKHRACDFAAEFVDPSHALSVESLSSSPPLLASLSSRHSLWQRDCQGNTRVRLWHTAPKETSWICLGSGGNWEFWPLGATFKLAFVVIWGIRQPRCDWGIHRFTGEHRDIS